jgi:hypothetical protein
MGQYNMYYNIRCYNYVVNMLRKIIGIGMLVLMFAAVVYAVDVGKFYPSFQFHIANGATYNITCESNYTQVVYTNASCLIVDYNINYTYCNATGWTNICFNTVTTTPAATTTLVNVKVFRWNVSQLHVDAESDVNESFIEKICLDLYRGTSICYNITSNSWSTS